MPTSSFFSAIPAIVASRCMDNKGNTSALRADEVHGKRAFRKGEERDGKRGEVQMSTQF